MSDIIRYEEIVGLLKDMGVLSAKILSKRVLIGLRKIGKTKLLETLADYGDSIINEYGGRNRYHFIYVDLARYLTIEKIQSHIMDQIKLKINIQSEYGKNPIHEIVKNVNISKFIPIFLYDHLERALELNQLNIADYYEIFCEGHDFLRFSWIASVSALDKTAYVNRLRSDGSQYAAAVSAILDRAGGFRINQLCKSDVEKLLHNLFQNYSILEDTAVVDKLYHDIGGLPYFLEKAVEFIDSYDKTWDEIRESFRETIRDDFFRYYFSEQGVLHTTDSFKLILQEGVDRSTGRISDKYLTLFIERGLCAPEEVAVPGLVWQLISEKSELIELPKKIRSSANGTYYVFIIDHENFWAALKEWFKSNNLNIYGFKDPRSRMSLFDHNYYTHPEYYKLQQGKLMEYIILKFKESWDNYFGSRDLDYPIAYAEWARFSHEHAKSYKNHRFWTDEPDLAVSPQSQAVDHKIFTDIAFNIQPTIEKTGKNPFYIIVSGDGGYGQALLELRRLGCQYQFWYFRSQNVRPFIKNLDDKQKIWLEDVLLLDQFSL